jgi:S-DNA-T family DNA segregation ATPase FtsK/SpoIIIE
MSTVQFRRRARRPAPRIPAGDLRIDPPPEVPGETGGRWQQMFVVLPMVGGGVAMAMMMGHGGGAYSYVVGAIFGVSSLAMLASLGGTPRRAEMTAARRDYLRHLGTLRRRARDTAARQTAGLLYRHPDPDHLGPQWPVTGSGSDARPTPTSRSYGSGWARRPWRRHWWRRRPGRWKTSNP